MNEGLMKNWLVRRKVLIVDDDSINRKILGRIISKDYDVVYAYNGKKALEIIREDSSLSLVMLDLLMPEMDGFELLKILGKEKILSRLPVIVLTSEQQSEVESLHLGAVDFIKKPYDLPDVIRARARRAIELFEHRETINETQTDSLTGLYNKQFFFHYCNLYDQNHPSEQTDAVFLDINRFHLTNEIYGRDFGDQILCSLSEYLLQVVGESSKLCARVYADTFYIYMPHRDDYEALLKNMTAKIFNEFKIKISIRLGVFSFSENFDVEKRFDCAKQACDKQRKEYNSSIGYYDEKMHEKELYDERLIADIEQALEEKQFIVYYQPQFDIRGDVPKLISAEALIRWIHPELGFINPGNFIPLFEQNGLIQKVDRYVWQEAAAQINRWKKIYGKTIPVSVNVSRIDILSADFENEISSIVKDNLLTPKEYFLEITESAYTDSSRIIFDKVNNLRNAGFKFEMDDFGSGYSSLNMLASLPIDVLKLDMAFVKNICVSEKDMRLVKLILEIAAYLNVPVIAEGVETKEQYELLKQAGTDIIQGYYFSKPLPEKEFNKLIETEMNNHD